MVNLFEKIFRNRYNVCAQFLGYVVIGGISFVIDAGTLWILERFMNYLIAVAISFMVGLIVNYLLSKKFVFIQDNYNKIFEFFTYALIGIVGLGITEGLMCLFTDVFDIYFMVSKIITAAIVLIWNFAARKIILYTKVANK